MKFSNKVCVRKFYGRTISHSVFFFCATFVAAFVQPVEPHAQDKPTNRPWIRGVFDTGLDVYRSGEDTDINLDQTLRLGIDLPNNPRYHFNTGLWLHEDLDGDEPSTSVLRSIDDAYDSDVQARLLYLNVEIDDLWGESVLRVGRQRILEGLAYNRIDGLYFRQDNARWDWYAFAGFRASLYENGHDDHSYGGGVSVRPSFATRLALDTFRAEEHRDRGDVVFRRPLNELLDRSFPRRVQRDIDDTAVALSVWHDFSQDFRIHARYIWKDGKGDELHLDAYGYSEKAGLTYEIALRTQLTSAGDQVSDLSGFFRILGVFEPYYNVFAALHRPINERLLLSFEAELHDAENDDPQSANRDYERFALIVSADNLGKGYEASASLEYWGVDGGEGSWVVTGEMRRRWETVTLTVGTDFERYEDRFIQFNPLPQRLSALRVALDPNAFPGFTPLVRIFDTTEVRTHENVYSLYTDVKWQVTENKDLRFGVSFEEDDGPDSPYWRMKADYTLRF